MRQPACKAILVFIALAVSCAATSPAGKDRATPGGKADSLTVFLTGNELGSMKPCGCSTGQLGGFSRRTAVLESVQPHRRLIVDTGNIVDGYGPQELLKFNVIMQAFSLLGYDLVNLTSRDLEIARRLGLLDGQDGRPKIITAPGPADVNLAPVFARPMNLDSRTIEIRVAALDARAGRFEQARALMDSPAQRDTVKILILNDCTTELLGSLRKNLAFADCLVCFDGSDKPGIIGDPEDEPLAISVGMLGRYVGKLDVTAPEPNGPLKLKLSAVPVTEQLPESEALVELYRNYQQLVRASGLLEAQPRLSLPGTSRYMGSQACKACHGYAYERWKQQGHAHAYQTLKQAGSDGDPECVLCHVVGLKYETGFVGPRQTPELEGVGCENCHGPGSEHVQSVGEKPLGEPRSDCTACHTPDNSVGYAGNEAKYFEKIVHWREPTAAGNVKNSKTESAEGGSGRQ